MLMSEWPARGALLVLLANRVDVDGNKFTSLSALDLRHDSTYFEGHRYLKLFFYPIVKAQPWHGNPYRTMRCVVITL